MEKDIKSMKICNYFQKNEDTDKKKVYDSMMSVGKELEFPIKILDNIISVEEQIYGHSIYNRGLDLKKSLIDIEKVQEYVQRQKMQPKGLKKSGNGVAAIGFLRRLPNLQLPMISSSTLFCGSC